VGVPGELYLGGAGLARGYDGRAELTAERFVADPFNSGHRLYRTGDVVRWRADGRLDFLGRGDGQVKLRGFRIELGEIEAVLARHAAVGVASVVVREDRPGVKRLVAYLVPAVGEVLDVDGVRQYMAERLPEYMVPSAFVVLDELPLTVNGKVDRKALPAPEYDTGDEYTAPRTLTEEALAAIWADVLGIERVGVHDDFFSLGGDSIISLQVVSRARRAGLALTSRGVFQYPTVASLSAVLDEAGDAEVDEARAQQELVVGEVATTPVREWFFDTHPVAPEHFNMSLAFELPHPVDLSALRVAVGALLVRHDALRSTFTRDEEGGGWTGRILAPADVDIDQVLTFHDLPVAPDRDDVWRCTVIDAQSGLDLAHGPLFRVVVGGSPDGTTAADGVDVPDGTEPARLLITAHHLVIDGVSWRILMGDLTAAYEQAVRGTDLAGIDLGAKSSSVGQWADRLNAYVRDGGFDDQVDYWRSVAERAEVRLPMDDPEGGNKVVDQAVVAANLDTDETDALLHQVPGRFRTQINDVLLAALTRTLHAWTGRDRIAVDMEGHGREELFDDIDLTRTVGWFTSIHPVALELPETVRGDDDWAGVMRSIKRQLRAVPDKGVGYGALRYLAGTSAVPALDPWISFNYLGQFGTGEAAKSAEQADSGGLLSRSMAAGGLEHAPEQERNHLIDVVAAVDDGRFVVTWYYSAAVHREETIAALAEDFVTALRSLIRG
jgi:non-ribosomal peptide synthase protein (TIGR01720 family)